MKYLEDEKLLKLTSELADVNLGRCRSIHGRIEAYTMKRVGTEKKYAHALGERYVADLENVESQLADYKTFMQRHAAKFGRQEPKQQLVGESPSKSGRGTTPAKNNTNNKKKQNKSGRKRSNSTGSPPTESDATGEKRPKQRRRSKSFDVSATAAAAATASVASTSILQKKPLGDFGEIGTRRLMTDLILTLNSSFPDYDFGSIKPVDFEKIGVKNAIKRVNERLAEVNTTKISFLPDMWSAMDDAVGLSDCEVYSYAPKTLDQDDDPLSFLTQTLIIENSNLDDHGDEHPSSAFMMTGASNDDINNNTTSTGDGAAASATVLWTFNYFFVNKSKKRIVFFTCVECMSRGEPVMSFYLDEEDDISYVQYQGTEASEVDFDLDPSAGVAGGIPVDVPISIM